jgi:hypothetical protein
MDSNTEPQLAPPGAGLPKPELYIARLFFAWKRWRGNRESYNAAFVRERERIRHLVQSCHLEQAARPVLIERVRGLEDSSRHWSVWMTLEHLRIVNSQIAGVITALCKGTIPPGKANTARVKPGKDITAAVIPAYEASCDAVLDAVTKSPNLKTKARFDHPWFGSLDASGWHSLAGGHMAIHRTQIERIIEGLR